MKPISIFTHSRHMCKFYKTFSYKVIHEHFYVNLGKINYNLNNEVLILMVFGKEKIIEGFVRTVFLSWTHRRIKSLLNNKITLFHREFQILAK